MIRERRDKKELDRAIKSEQRGYGTFVEEEHDLYFLLHALLYITSLTVSSCSISSLAPMVFALLSNDDLAEGLTEERGR